MDFVRFHIINKSYRWKVPLCSVTMYCMFHVLLHFKSTYSLSHLLMEEKQPLHLKRFSLLNYERKNMTFEQQSVCTVLPDNGRHDFCSEEDAEGGSGLRGE